MASSLVFFVSFLRAVVSLSIVAILPKVSALFIVVFLLSPIAINLILEKYLKINYSSLIAIIWILGVILSIFQTNQIFRFCLFILGLGLTMIEIGKYLRMKGMKFRQGERLPMMGGGKIICQRCLISLISRLCKTDSCRFPIFFGGHEIPV